MTAANAATAAATMSVTRRMAIAHTTCGRDAMFFASVANASVRTVILSEAKDLGDDDRSNRCRGR